MLEVQPSTPLTIFTPQAARKPSAPRPTRSLFLTLLALTIFAALTRFLFLSRPGIWTDEAATFLRVSGSWGDMLFALSEFGGFAPLHYELYWLLAHFFTPTPFVMRMVPALAGTLMVPAMYYLARQLVPRKTALLTAAFTACSAWLMVFSRDAKMYEHFWLFTTMSMASYLAWVRTNFRIHWLLWIFFSLGMVGLHSLGAIVLVIQPIMLLAQRPTLRRLALWFVGCALIAVGPILYYVSFNNFFRHIEQRGWNASMLQWVDSYNYKRSGGDLLLETTSAFTVSWEWPKKQQVIDRIQPQVYKLCTVGVVALLALAALGIFPWHSTKPPTKEPPQPWPRSLLWIGLWLILPTYAFYCLSTPDFVAPWQWFHALLKLVENRWTPPMMDDTNRWFIVGGLFFALVILCLLSHRIAQMLAFAIPGYLLVSLADRFITAGTSQPLTTLQEWLSNIFNPGLIVIAIALLPPAIWYFAGNNFRTRMDKTTRLFGVFATWFAAATALYFGLWLFTRYSFQFDWHKFSFGMKERNYDFHSIWMPRYLGIVWPAFAIAIATLCMRLPNRAIRVAVISLFLTANLCNAFARVYVSPEAPVGSAAVDALAGQFNNPTTRTYIGWAPIRVSPGEEWIPSPAWAYYSSLLTGKRIVPHKLFEIFIPSKQLIPISDGANPWMIALDARTSPKLKQIIVWQYQVTPMTDDDLIARTLGKSWKRTSEKSFRAFDHWTWAATGYIRRREYVKQSQ